MTRATRKMAAATCECGFRISANADRLRCPACKSWIVLDATAEPRATREQRRERAETRAANTRRLVGWLRFFRQPIDAGLGDTIARLVVAAGEREIGQQIQQLAKTCDCKKEDWQQTWNERYPYTEDANNATKNPATNRGGVTL